MDIGLARERRVECGEGDASSDRSVDGNETGARSDRTMSGEARLEIKMSGSPSAKTFIHTLTSVSLFRGRER